MSRRIGDEHVILDVDRGIYFGLDPIGSRIWELLEGEATCDEIAATLAAEYEVSEDQARNDLARLVEQLDGHGLVTRT
jgi:hypothetical protein